MAEIFIKGVRIQLHEKRKRHVREKKIKVENEGMKIII